MTDPRPITALLAAVRDGHAGAPSLPVRICAACVASMPIDGAALSLLREPSGWERVGASDEATARVEDLQLTLGDCPAAEALASGRPVLIGDLSGPETERWPAFAEAIPTTDMRALFVLPMQLGAVRLGALSLYRREPGAMGPQALTDAVRATDLIAMLFLGPEGRLANDVERDWLDQSSWTREVHQATGMLVSQLGVAAPEAFVRMRAHAFATNRPLNEVAADVVARRLTLADTGDR